MSYHAKITSKGQITLPAELRKQLRLQDGDSVEFYVDSNGQVFMRAVNALAGDVYRQFKGEVMKRQFQSDDDAIAAAVADRDARARPRKRTRKSAA